MIRPHGDTGASIPRRLAKKIRLAQRGFAVGLAARLAMEGTGGTYFLRNPKKQPILVFKPADEEAFAPNNPRSYTGTMGQPSFRPGIFSGRGYLREVAAFLMDHGR